MDNAEAYRRVISRRTRKADNRAKTRSITFPTDPKTSTLREGEKLKTRLRKCNLLQLTCGLCSVLCDVRLSLSGEGTVFEQQASSAVLDLMGDEGDRLNQHKNIMKWLKLIFS